MTSKHIKENDFFNLNSDNTDSDEEEKNKKIRKWNWDDEENHDLYFGKKIKTIQEKKPNTSKNILNDFNKINDNQSKLYMEKSIIENKIILNLVGHTSSANRIHWSKRYELRNLLLSSSMDR